MAVHQLRRAAKRTPRSWTLSLVLRLLCGLNPSGRGVSWAVGNPLAFPLGIYWWPVSLGFHGPPKHQPPSAATAQSHLVTATLSCISQRAGSQPRLHLLPDMLPQFRSQELVTGLHCWLGRGDPAPNILWMSLHVLESLWRRGGLLGQTLRGTPVCWVFARGMPAVQAGRDRRGLWRGGQCCCHPVQTGVAFRSC